MTRNWLEIAMEHHGITVAELAKHLGVSYEYVLDIIAGKVQRRLSPKCILDLSYWLHIDNIHELEKEYCDYRDRLEKCYFIEGDDVKFVYKIYKDLSTFEHKQENLEFITEEYNLQRAYLLLKYLYDEHFSVTYNDCKFDESGRRDSNEYLAQMFLKEATEYIRQWASIFIGQPHIILETELYKVKVIRVK